MDKTTFIEQVAAVMAGYQPSDAARTHIAEVRLIAAVGPSGVGKSTIMSKSGLPYVLSDVSREPRGEEQDGVQYHFRSDYEAILQEIGNGDYVQYILTQWGEFYGTRYQSYVQTEPCVMSVVASAVPIFQRLGFHSVVPIFVVPPDYSEWMRRLSTHRERNLESRLLEAKESIAIALANPDFQFIENIDLMSAVHHFRETARGRADGAENTRARVTAAQILERLNQTIR